MGRAVATAVHLTLWVLAGVLYFLFVLPRWWELMGDTSHTLGTVLRIGTGILFAVAALPGLLTLIRTHRPEHDTPALAVRLRVSSVALHVLAGVLIVGTAVAEIWVSLDSGGPWLFAVYGAAAAVAVLGLLAFYLAYTAEQAPKPPKPKKEKKPKTAEPESESAEEAEPDEDAEADEEAEPSTADTAEEAAAPEQPEALPEPRPVDDEEPAGGLRNKRPSGKSSHRLRRRDRGKVALDEPED
ncbi:hypothetical protein B1R94_26745 [Mycolicibacterium litorale]|nr:hypothetical protein B1R94_26745 [Mycolicibacterium litorale]